MDSFGYIIVVSVAHRTGLRVTVHYLPLFLGSFNIGVSTMANTKIDLVEGYTIKTVGKQSFAVSIIQIDPVESKAGKSIVLASTRGAKTIVVDGEEVRFNVNVNKLKNQAKA